MEDVYKAILLGHVICGFAALSIGLLIILAKKSGRIHIVLGNAYFWSMTGVFVSSMIMVMMKFNPFLLGVGIFSYHLVFTGFRFGRMKGYHKLTNVDKVVSWATFISSIAMLSYAAYSYFIAGHTGVGIILGIFGALCLSGAVQDIKRFGKKVGRHEWLFMHISRMLGGLIATTTAFLLTAMAGMLPPLVLWLGPGVIGGLGITLTLANYRKKLGADRRGRVIAKS